MNETQLIHVPTTIKGKLLIRTPNVVSNNSCVLALHGYGESAAIMMQRLEPWLDSGFSLACAQALHPIYLPNQKVGHSWMTSDHREEAITQNLVYLENVIQQLKEEVSFSNLIVLGYSQGAQMAMRVTRWLSGDHLIAVCGELPPELREKPLYGNERQPISALLARGKKDIALTQMTMSENQSVLEKWGGSCAAFELPGAHRWLDDWTDLLTPWLSEASSAP